MEILSTPGPTFGMKVLRMGKKGKLIEDLISSNFFQHGHWCGRIGNTCKIHSGVDSHVCLRLICCRTCQTSCTRSDHLTLLGHVVAVAFHRPRKLAREERVSRVVGQFSEISVTDCSLTIVVLFGQIAPLAHETIPGLVEVELIFDCRSVVNAKVDLQPIVVVYLKVGQLPVFNSIFLIASIEFVPVRHTNEVKAASRRIFSNLKEPGQVVFSCCQIYLDLG